MATRPIDYSKWDNVGASDDDDAPTSGSSEDDAHPDNEEDAISVPLGGGRKKPVVTRLDHPSSVSIGPSGIQVSYPPKATASPFLSSGKPLGHNPSAPAPRASKGTTAERDVGATTTRQRNEEADITDDLEDDLLLQKLTRNGQHVAASSAAGAYLWSQTRDTATVCVTMPSMAVRGTNIKSFSVQKVSDAADVAVDGAAILAFQVDGTEYRFHLRYPVNCDPELLDGCWQLHSLPSKGMRLLVIELHKDDFAKGMYLWWDRLCVQESPIDTSKLEDRRSTVDLGNVQRVWNEAHDEFRLRMKTQRARHEV